jgi:hypothetical protein
MFSALYSGDIALDALANRSENEAYDRRVQS